MGLAKAPELFAAGVDIHGVHDWNNVVKNFIPSYDANNRTDWAKIAYESSPMPYVSTWKAPVLMIHGDDTMCLSTKRLLWRRHSERIMFTSSN